MTRVSQWVPGLASARRYDRSWLRHDVVAGLVLTAVLIPAGIGYAEASGLPAVTGLYATIVPLLAYALFGPSRVLILGPDSALAPIIAASIIPLAAGDPDRAVALAGLLALMMGSLLLLGGLLRLGFVTDLLSKPIRLGYLNGIALVVIVGQLPKLFGFSVEDGSAVDDVRGFVTGLSDGDASALASAFGIGALVGIIGIGMVWSRTAGMVTVVIASMVIGRDRRVARRPSRGRGIAVRAAGSSARRTQLGRRAVTRGAGVRHRAHRVHRHERALPGIRRPTRLHRLGEPRDAGDRPDEHGLGRLRRLPGVGIVVSHAGRGTGRRADSARGCRRSRGARRLRPVHPRSHQLPAFAGTGSRRDRRRLGTVRRAHVRHVAARRPGRRSLGPGCIPRRRARRRAGRHRDRSGAVTRRLREPGVATVPSGTGPSPRCARLPRPLPSSARRGDRGRRHRAVRRAPVLRQRRDLRRVRPLTRRRPGGGEVRDPGCGADHERRLDGRRRTRAASTMRSPRRASSW